MSFFQINNNTIILVVYFDLQNFFIGLQIFKISNRLDQALINKCQNFFKNHCQYFLIRLEY